MVEATPTLTTDVFSDEEQFACEQFKGTEPLLSTFLEHPTHFEERNPTPYTPLTLFLVRIQNSEFLPRSGRDIWECSASKSSRTLCFHVRKRQSRFPWGTLTKTPAGAYTLTVTHQVAHGRSKAGAIQLPGGFVFSAFAQESAVPSDELEGIGAIGVLFGWFN